jgi:hypothetical protein
MINLVFLLIQLKKTTFKIKVKIIINDRARKNCNQSYASKINFPRVKINCTKVYSLAADIEHSQI